MISNDAVIEAVIQKTAAKAAPEAHTPAGEAFVKQVNGAEPGGTKPADEGAEKKPDAELRSAQFVALSKQERKLQAKRAELAAEREALETARTQNAKDKEEVRLFNERKAKAKLDPVNAVRDLLGLEYSDLTEAILNDGSATTDQKVAALSKEIENIRSENAKRNDDQRKNELEGLKEQEAKEVQTWRQGISDFLEGNAEKYEGIALFQVQSMVPELIRHHFAETKKILTNEEASNLIEETLWDHIEKATKSKRWTEKVKVATASRESKSEKTKRERLTEEQLISRVIAKADSRRTR